MTSEIWRDFDPNLAVPEGLINVKVVPRSDIVEEYGEPDADIDIQEETLNDDDSQLDEDDDEDTLAVPGSFVIISQTVRFAPDGSQVVDVVFDIEEVEGADNYEIRIAN